MKIEDITVTAEMMLAVMEEEMDRQECRIKALRRIGYELLLRLANYESTDYMRAIEEELRG